MRIGLIGCGAIGRALLDAADRGGLAPEQRIVAVLVRRQRPSPSGVLVTTDPTGFLAEQPAAVIEVAGHDAVRAHGVACLAAGADLVVTSVGALADDALRSELEEAARRAGRRVIVASAGIGALDILAGAAQGGLERVTVTVRKDASAWRGTAAESRIDLGDLREPAVLFDGPVREGALAYPQNVNIAAAAALAGLGLDRTRLVIVADPTVGDHVVTIDAEGAFGRFSFREEVRPTAENPKTGRLVAMAVLRTVRDLAAPLVIGH